MPAIEATPRDAADQRGGLMSPETRVVADHQEQYSIRVPGHDPPVTIRAARAVPFGRAARRGLLADDPRVLRGEGR
jgi:hypothetical protein